MPSVESIKFVKSQVSISLSDGVNFMILPDIYYSSGIREGIDYDKEHIKKILEQNADLLCRNALLKIVSRRLHSTGEIRKKLSLAGFSQSQISEAISKSIDSGIINEESAADSYFRELTSKGYGLRRIREAFRKKGFSSDSIEAKLGDDFIDEEAERQNAHSVFDKKFFSLLRLKITDKNKLQEKLYRHMLSKGYSSDLIFSLMKEIDFKDDSEEL